MGQPASVHLGLVCIPLSRSLQQGWAPLALLDKVGSCLLLPAQCVSRLSSHCPFCESPFPPQGPAPTWHQWSSSWLTVLTVWLLSLSYGFTFHRRSRPTPRTLPSSLPATVSSLSPQHPLPDHFPKLRFLQNCDPKRVLLNYHSLSFQLPGLLTSPPSTEPGRVPENTDPSPPFPSQV